MNHLIHESSPYFKQHANNPVDWYPWGQEALQKAKNENKALLISIGYASCHWCHVMERESFTNERIAALMNENFVCIKVDREERPDIDQIYMHAIQVITGHGGWPLNIFALPDGRPFYGGTYFPPKSWISLLENVRDLFRNELVKLENQADNITMDINDPSLVFPVADHSLIRPEDLRYSIDRWKTSFDRTHGGMRGAPKFPMPVNLQFLSRYSLMHQDQELMKFVEITLAKMAEGGIYDQLEGGFSRYSTDEEWHIPHFEKMLYDNAQLIVLYSEAWQVTKNELYRRVVSETIDFVLNRLTGPDGEFYSALDADSDGKEGLSYVWQQDEIDQLLGEDSSLFCDYFGLTASHERLPGGELPGEVLRKKMSLEDLARLHKVDIKTAESRLNQSRKTLLAQRNQRNQPATDDKTLLSWNAMMAGALVVASLTFENQKYREAGIKNLQFITNQMINPAGGLWHRYKEGVSGIHGFAEDYAWLVDAMLKATELNLPDRPQWVENAELLMQEAISLYGDENTGMFWFTSDQAEPLVARKMEVVDNVIPSSNSVMARNLIKISQLTGNEEYLERAKKMTAGIRTKSLDYPGSFANWHMAALELANPNYLKICTPEGCLML